VIAFQLIGAILGQLGNGRLGLGTGGRGSREIGRTTPCKAVARYGYSDSSARRRMARIIAPTSRLRAIASAEKLPCLKAFLLPFGAPGDFPPCIRQRPFGIAADRHMVPLRVRAPHRAL
jgi:hypothetical protein